jgi:tetratricopeptide (TPR) repeat protein
MGACRIFLFGIAMLFAITSARAEWHQASSDHFVIYADQKEEQIRHFAERLERYHSATQYVLGRESKTPSRSNRVTVYVVDSAEKVRKLYGGGGRYVAGFYTPRAGGTLAIVPRITSGESEFEMSGLTVLLHEYAHHVMYSDAAYSYPLWYSEGFAEFFASASFAKDGTVSLGRPAMHRAYELILAKNVPIERLLDTKAYLASKEKSKAYDEFYGRSWALFHYLTFSASRKGQMSNFLSAIRQGKPDIDAAKEAFGDLKLLDKELNKYLDQSKMSALFLKPDKLKIGEIVVRKLDGAEAAAMPYKIQSKRGVDEEMAKKLISGFRPVATKFPNSAPVLAALAEAEYDAGNDDAAIAAADKALTIDPKNIDALVQKGNVLVRQAESAADGKKAWATVRRHYQKLNQIENDHPIPLIRYYQSYVENGDEPTSNALDGLVWAMQLAPFDQSLRMTVGNALIEAKSYDDAMIALEPLAKNGHDPDIAEAAQKLIDSAKEKKAAAKAGAEIEGKAAPPAKTMTKAK